VSKKSKKSALPKGTTPNAADFDGLVEDILREIRPDVLEDLESGAAGASSNDSSATLSEAPRSEPTATAAQVPAPLLAEVEELAAKREGVSVNALSSTPSAECRSEGKEPKSPVPTPVHPEARPVDASARQSVTSAEQPSDDWPMPEALRSPTIPDFPLEALGDWHRRFVEELAEELRCCVDGPGAMSLAILSGAAANTCMTRVEHDHPIQLWTLWITESGEGKSPVMARCLQPMRLVQDRLSRDHAEMAHERSLELIVERRRLSDASRRAAKSDSEAEALAARKEMRSIHARILTLSAGGQPLRLTTTDATPAGLVRGLAQPGQRLILATEEASEIFWGILRRSRQDQEDIQAMLQAHSSAPIEHDRGNGSSVYLARPALSIAAAMQPVAFDKVMAVPSFHDQGLIARFLLTKPRPRTGARLPPRQRVRHETEYDRRVTALLNLDPSQPGRVLVLNDGANERLESLAAEIDERCDEGGDLHCCKAWAGKLRGNVIRLASVMALADDPATTVIEATIMERAENLGRYFLGHAVALFRTGAEFVDDHNAEIVLKWIKNRRQGSFSHRQAMRSHGGRLRGEDVMDALELLEHRGYIRRGEDVRRPLGRPRAPSYLVHPRVLQRS
jgi:replicative DNA helicase